MVQFENLMRQLAVRSAMKLIVMAELYLYHQDQTYDVQVRYNQGIIPRAKTQLHLHTTEAGHTSR